MRCGCGICKGKLGEIHYDEPSDSLHPLSFVIDEIIPVSRYRLGGYDSAEDAANDWSNLQAAHWICNARKSNKLESELNVSAQVFVSDGDW
jgi:5-methylcytosine-specific restriction endonuclease McrA